MVGFIVTALPLPLPIALLLKIWSVDLEVGFPATVPRPRSLIVLLQEIRPKTQEVGFILKTLHRLSLVALFLEIQPGGEVGFPATVPRSRSPTAQLQEIRHKTVEVGSIAPAHLLPSSAALLLVIRANYLAVGFCATAFAGRATSLRGRAEGGFHPRRVK